ncbi:MAG: hypothetical protein RL407_2028 [Bacteroidota bacterium]|jgi:hypothetical protein
MQLEKIRHVLSLIWKKFHVDKILLGVIYLVFSVLPNFNWLAIELRLDISIPFSDVLLPSLSLNLTGWQFLGYFAWAPFAVLPLFFFKAYKKFIFPIALTLVAAVAMYTLHLSELEKFTPGFVLAKVERFSSLYFYFINLLCWLGLSFISSK